MYSMIVTMISTSREIASAGVIVVRMDFDDMVKMTDAVAKLAYSDGVKNYRRASFVDK
jgi:hypothetical protein